ncbi:hypothetical protein E2562_034557 [Oryza meyeriana var. granulata]|uniref:Uncharacterized protein n=1 Tax=Oryza meyeriana var. granulata TaxID=110450 RepID=A0A6G1EEN8_9ORYZ|nr:hypothetical protein E2562_034557 [Oryza meyeriana var. granulata]
MDESEAGGLVRRCEDCLEYGHRTRDCTENKDGATSTTVPRQQTCDSSRGMENDWPYPLLCRDIDARHRAQQMLSGYPNDLTVFMTRTSGIWQIDQRWVPRQEDITMSKKLTTMMDKIGTHGV